MSTTYNEITYPNSSFVFDKIYTSFKEAQENANSDSVLLGRYVLIAYCEKAFPQDIRVRLESLNSSTGLIDEDEINYYTNYQKDSNANYTPSKDRVVCRKVYRNDSFLYEEIVNLSTSLETTTINTLTEQIGLLESFFKNEDDTVDLTILNDIKLDLNNIAGLKTEAGGEIFNNYNNNLATAPYSHAEGDMTIVNGYASHVEGISTTASGDFSHSEGSNTLALGMATHSEGFETQSMGTAAHSEGEKTSAKGDTSHAEGYGTQAQGYASHAGGIGTIATAEAQTVIGMYNETNDDALFIVGNGSDNDNRSNAFEVYKDGHIALNEEPVNDTDMVNKKYTDQSIKNANLATLNNKKYLLIGDSYGQGALTQLGVYGWAPLFAQKMGLTTNLVEISNMLPEGVPTNGEVRCYINTLGGSGFCHGLDPNSYENVKLLGAENRKYYFKDLLEHHVYMKEKEIEEAGKTVTTREIIITNNEIMDAEKRKEITDIIVCGGYNDKNAEDSGAIAKAINEFIKEAKRLYPNALVSIGMIGSSAIGTARNAEQNTTITQELGNKVLQGYVGATTQSLYSYRYLANVEYALKLHPNYMITKNDEGEIISDGIHPTQVGYKLLANAISKAVMGGFTAGSGSYMTPLVPEAGYTFTDSSDMNLSVKINNGITELRQTAFGIQREGGITFTIDGNKEFIIGSYPNSLIAGSEDRNTGTFVPVTGIARCDDDNKVYITTGVIGFIKGKLVLVPYILNGSQSSWMEGLRIKYFRVMSYSLTTATNIY